MTDVQTFTGQIGDVSVTVRAISVNGSSWFCGADIATSMGYHNHQQAVRAHVDDTDRKALASIVPVSDGLSHNAKTEIYINDSGLYSLLYRGKKARSAELKRWLQEEVCPNIQAPSRQPARDAEPEEPLAVTTTTASGGSMPTAYDLEMLRGARMQTLTAAYTAAQAVGSSSKSRVEAEIQRAIDAIILPQEEPPEQYVDAAQILLERGHTAEQVKRFATEFGKDLKILATSEGLEPRTRECRYGADIRQVLLYHRVHDGPLIEAAYDCFKRQRPLFAQVMAAEQDPVRNRREQLLQRDGRGRSRSQRRGAEASRPSNQRRAANSLRDRIEH